MQSITAQMSQTTAHGLQASLRLPPRHLAACTPCLGTPFSATCFRPNMQQDLLRKSTIMSVSLKIKDYDGVGDFTLEEQQQETLCNYLGNPAFCEEVRANAGIPEGSTMEFTGMLFQPVPWSPSTRKGMPQVRDIKVAAEL